MTWLLAGIMFQVQMMRMSIVIVGRNFAKDAANAKDKVNISWNCQLS